VGHRRRSERNPAAPQFRGVPSQGRDSTSRVDQQTGAQRRPSRKPG